MRFEIAQSLNGDKVIYIARDTNGVVRLRNETLEALHVAINEYNETLAKDAAARAKAKSKGKGVKAKGEALNVKGEEVLAEEALEEEAVEVVQSQTSEVVESPQPPEPTQPTQETESSEAKKKFLHSNIKEQIEEKKSRSGKTSFWDKLK